jgi:hypothetical protein
MGFVVPLEDVSVHEKKQAKFECIITKEVSKVMWFRRSDIITPSPKYELIDDGKKHMLIINSCEIDDESQYSIEVLDQKSCAQLTVEGMYGIAAQVDLNPSFSLLLGVWPYTNLSANLLYSRNEAQIYQAPSEPNPKGRLHGTL